MSRRKSSKVLTKQLAYAEAREAYKAPAREAGSSVTKRVKLPLRYRAMSLGEAVNEYFTVRASKASLDFFGDESGVTLGLAEPQGDGPIPRGFKPAKVHAHVGGSQGETVVAKGSARPYIKYSGASAQNSFSCPITSTTGIPGVVTAIKNLYTEKKATLGDYGRIFYSPEYFPISE